MTTKTHFNPSQEIPVLASTSPLVTFSGSMGIPGQKNTPEALETLTNDFTGLDPFTYTLAALPHLEQRLKWGKVTTLEGQPIADLWAFLRAAETGQL